MLLMLGEVVVGVGKVLELRARRPPAVAASFAADAGLDGGATHSMDLVMRAKLRGHLSSMQIPAHSISGNQYTQWHRL